MHEKGKIIVIDDEKMCLRMIHQFLLGSKTYDVEYKEEFNNPVIAVQRLIEISQLKVDKIDIVICDYQMKVMDGLGILKAIRVGFDGIVNNLKFIMLTGTNDFKVVEIAKQLDVNGFLIKPVAKDKFMAMLDRVMNTDHVVKAPEHYKNIEARLES